MNKDGQKKRVRQTDIPSVTISEALRIATALRDQFALGSATPVDIGKAIGIKPTSGGFRMITGASIAYGLTDGGYNAASISLTPLGRRAVSPEQEGDDESAKREAFEKPRIINEFIGKYNGNKLPKTEIAQNVIHRFGVPFEATERVFEILLMGLKDLGYLQEIHGDYFLQRPQAGQPLMDNVKKQETQEPPDDVSVSCDQDEAEQQLETVRSKPNAIFLGHGKNKKPLEQLIKILEEYGIPYKTAETEPNAGRPIPIKVAETMRECGAAILIFTADEKFFDEAGNVTWRPSENVAHELGAASVLYGDRIIIFKEDDVELASNYSSIGYIDFSKDKLKEKGVELFRELKNYKIIQISVSG